MAGSKSGGVELIDEEPVQQRAVQQQAPVQHVSR
jgi:hypothetical protein